MLTETKFVRQLHVFGSRMMAASKTWQYENLEESKGIDIEWATSASGL
jgi:hypothetical protein